MAPDQEVARLEARIADLELRIFSIKEELAKLDDASVNLSLDAADRRASNALQGRGLGGALLGAKYRAAARRSAAADNARLSRQVAERRREIAAAKQGWKAQERAVRLEIASLKNDLRSAKALARQAQTAARRNPPVLPSPSPPKSQPDTAAPGQISKEELRLRLQKLKALYESGKLTAAQYEHERIMLLTPFT